MEPKNNNLEQDISLKRGGRSFFMTLIICLVVFFVATALLILAFNRLISRHDQFLSSEICTIMSEKMNSSIEFMTASTGDMASILSSHGLETPGEAFNAILKDRDSGYLSGGFIDENGILYASEEEKAEFEKWDLLRTAAMAKPVSMSAPYRSSIYGQPVITLFAELEYDGGRHGCMFTTYRFKNLQVVARTRSLDNDVDIWLMHADSANMIQCAGSDEHAIGGWSNAFLTMNTVNSADISVYRNWIERIRNDEDNVGINYSVGETFYSLHSACIKSMPGWYVVVRIPGNALSATMHTFRNYVLCFLAVLLVIVLVLIANMYRMSKRDNEMLEMLSTHDPLTGALNRRAFDHAARRMMTGEKDCALIYFDLDFFKQVNDGLGHSVGDRLLVTFADSLGRNLPEHSIISRFGGDEFVVLAAMDSTDDITARINRISEDIHAFKPARDESGQSSHSFSFSSGASRFPYDSKDLPTLMKQADAALYEVKERGRDGILWYADLS